MGEVKWIKICTDIFDDEKILMIESLPERDSIIVIWFKLLCLAGKQNNSGVFLFSDKIPYTDEMLSTIFRRPLNTVRFALKTFEQYGMIEIVNETITIPKWEKHQKLDALELSREQTRKRVEKYREKQKDLIGNVTCNVTDGVTVTQCNADRIEEDKDIDKDIDNKVYISIVEYLNQKAGTRYRATSSKTKTAIHARLEEGFTEEDFRTVIDKKCAEWIGTEWEKFLRPETLFGTKFESYLNAKVTNGKQQTTTKQHTQTDDFMEQLKAMYTPGG